MAYSATYAKVGHVMSKSRSVDQILEILKNIDCLFIYKLYFTEMSWDTWMANNLLTCQVSL